MKTSYFAKYKGPNSVSIARGTPAWYNGAIEPRLFPTWELINGIKKNIISEQVYEEKYRDIILDKLDPKEIYEQYADFVLLCWERIGEFCHRRIVASWIEEAIGIEIEEYGTWRA